ncbi:MAG TPA: FadR/GntR family transcriptional regulator [Rectinemataceae bacterium]|nr:FadR/GntR family transcriptional regulator [Rectinemataceae bacterium]
MDTIDYRLEKKNLYESVAAKMEKFILENADQFGQKLPSEQTLATNFGVSRPVVREALKLLKERQLIESHTGGGTYIRKPGTQNLIDVIQRMIQMDCIDYPHVFDMRLLLEPYACRLAATNHLDDAKLAALEATIEKMIENEHHTDERVYYDLQFHTLIAQYSENPILAAFVQSMTGLLTPIIREALIPSDGHRSGVDYHKHLLEILRKGDGDEAERLMREHLVVSSKNYLKIHTSTT